MKPPPPEKFLMVPDDFHLNRLGRLKDGRFCFQSMTLHIDREEPPFLDYVCSFIFDEDGTLTAHRIDLIGRRDEYNDTWMRMICARHEKRYGPIDPSPVWIRPFFVESHGTIFGLVAEWYSDHAAPDLDETEAAELPDEEDEGNWAVIFEPGNTLAFYEPWDSGEYDT